MKRNAGSPVMILNPKPKKAKKRKATSAKKHAASKPRKAPKRRSKSYKRNPAPRSRGAAAGALASPLPLPKIGKLDIGFALVTGAGIVGHGMATNFVADKVPVPQLKSGAGKFGLGLALAIAGSYAAHAFAPKKFAVPLTVGMGASVVVQGLNTFVFPKLPQLPVSGYESIDMLSGMEGYDEIPDGIQGMDAITDDRFASSLS